MGAQRKGGPARVTDSDRYQRLRRLLSTASGLSAPELKLLLDDECADDPTLRHDVEALLATEFRHGTGWGPLTLLGNATSKAKGRLPSLQVVSR
jgi:hypothetical protein